MSGRRRSGHRTDGGSSVREHKPYAAAGERTSAGDEAGLRSRLRTGWRRGLRGILEAVRGGLAHPTTSDVVALVLTLGLCLSVGTTLLGPRLAGVATVAGVGVALTGVLLASENPLRRGIGGALAAPTALLVATPVTMAGAFALGVPGFGPFAAVTVWALIFAALAATLASWERLGTGGAREAATGSMLATTGVILVLIARVAPEAGVREEGGAAFDAVGDLLFGLLISPGEGVAVIGFFGLMLLFGVLVWFMLSSVPFERLAPPDRQAGVTRVIAFGNRVASIGIRLALLGIFAAIIVPPVVDPLDEVPVSPSELQTAVPAPFGEGLATLVTASGLRWLLLAGIAGVVLIIAAEWTRGAIRRGLAQVAARVVAPMIGGAILTIALASALTDPGVEATLEGIIVQIEPQAVGELLLEFPTIALVVGLLLVALGLLSSLLITVSLLRSLRLLPPRAVGASLAAVAIFGLGISLAIIGRPEAAIVTAVGAFVIWDVGEYADGIRVELGRDASTMRAELVHAAGACLIGTVVAVSTIGLYRTVATDAPVVDPRLAGAALAMSLGALLAVAWVLRK